MVTSYNIDSTSSVPLAQTVERSASNAKVMGLIARKFKHLWNIHTTFLIYNNIFECYLKMNKYKSSILCSARLVLFD